MSVCTHVYACIHFLLCSLPAAYCPVSDLLMLIHLSEACYYDTEIVSSGTDAERAGCQHTYLLLPASPAVLWLCLQCHQGLKGQCVILLHSLTTLSWFAAFSFVPSWCSALAFMVSSFIPSCCSALPFMVFSTPLHTFMLFSTHLHGVQHSSLWCSALTSVPSWCLALNFVPSSCSALNLYLHGVQHSPSWCSALTFMVFSTRLHGVQHSPLWYSVLAFLVFSTYLHGV